MAGWHVVEKYLEETGKHSTLIGKYWITMFLVLRLLILFSICEAAFGDVGLECDTKTPGCQKMCINQFYPIQPNSYWSLQMLFVSLPIMIFMVYCNHKQEKISISRKLKKAHLEEQKEKKKKENEEILKKIKSDREQLEQKKEVAEQLYENPYGKRFTSNEIQAILNAEEERIKEIEKQFEDDYDGLIKKEDDCDDKATKSSGSENSTPPKLFLSYALMVFCRTGIEIAFLVYYFHIYTFTFVMPEQYQCQRAPCNNVVACYVDRPKQKTLVIYIMFGSGCITVLVGLIEFWSLGMGKIFEAWSNRHDDITNQYKVGQMVKVDDVGSNYGPPPNYMSIPPGAREEIGIPDQGQGHVQQIGVH